MDKNSAIGLTLIILIFIGFNFMNMPSEEERAEMQRVQDSIESAEAIQQEQQEKLLEEEVAEQTTSTIDATQTVAP